MKIIELWQYVGSGSYFGSCFRCGSQFMSLRDRLAIIEGVKVCERCAMKVAAA